MAGDVPEVDRRSVSTDALDTLGTIIDATQKRDAIHLAVDPVIAGERLAPGEHIVVKDGVAHGCDAGKGLGIVDPFLLRDVMKGERCWFVMYPRQVRSLRHVWSHPAFPDEPIAGATLDDPARSKAASEKWLREFANETDGAPGYETMIASAVEHQNYGGDYIIIQGSDAHCDIPPEFWNHVENVTGKKMTRRAGHFSCSC